MIIALGTGLAPHLSKAVLEGWNQMAGEFVRTPKHGVKKGRYTARAELPMVEIGMSLLSFASMAASLRTGHYFATPFAMLFTIGYGYVAVLITREQTERRRASVEVTAAAPALQAATLSEPPPASGEQWVGAEPSVSADMAA